MEEEKVETPAAQPVEAAEVKAPTGVTSETGSGSVPEEIKGWNWGAFFLTWIWGLGNHVWISLVVLLGFIPFIGPIIALVMAIMLGLKGSEWAWQNRKFASVDEFKKIQKVWAIWGLVIFVIGIVFTIAMWSVVIGLMFGSGMQLDY